MLVSILGALATIASLTVIIWNIQKQIHLNYKRMSHEGSAPDLVYSMFIIYLFWGIYGLVKPDWFIVSTDIIAVIFSSIMVWQLLYRYRKRQKQKLYNIHHYYKVTWLDDVKDYSVLEHTDGYILAGESNPVGVLHTHKDAKRIALLEFAYHKPRGNHFHNQSTEYLVVLQGKLECTLFLPDDHKECIKVTLSVGQQICIFPGCAHTYVAIGGKNVYALEYTDQRYKMSDVIRASYTLE